jgi:branched-chain amino acid transport system ATP-binding protein
MADRTNGQPLLQIDAVTRRFGGLTAVSEVTFDLAEGEALGLIGANGAGKTTLFNCMTGFDKPTEGDVRFRGDSILKRKRHQIVGLGMSRTFQIVRPFRDLPVIANVMVPLISAGAGKEAKKRAVGVLARVGLVQKALVPSGQLSEGDLKRLELARALATEPTLLLLDEPFAGLSQSEIGVLSETVKALRSEGVSMVIVEHKIGSLLPLVDRVVAMDLGKKIADGDPQEVMRSPAVVRAYLGGDPDQVDQVDQVDRDDQDDSESAAPGASGSATGDSPSGGPKEPSGQESQPRPSATETLRTGRRKP